MSQPSIPSSDLSPVASSFSEASPVEGGAVVPSVGPAASETASQWSAPTPIDPLEGSLVDARLGVFSGLFYALRAKHPPTAAHSLRVALACSRWAEYRKMEEDERGLLEVAALLHDIGKIGIPDSVLQKKSQLSSDEQLLMEMKHEVAAELLTGSGAKEKILKLVRSSRRSTAESLQERSDSANMLAIVDAFDSMTTQQVFRRALSRDAAVDELFAHTSTQFSPELVKDFAELIGRPRPELDNAIASRWLQRLVPDQTPGFETDDINVSCGAKQSIVDAIFQPRLISSMSDAAIYLDAGGQILLWNRAAEEITGRQAKAVMHRSWDHELMGFVDPAGEPLDEGDCPLAQMLSTNTKTTRRLTLRHVDGRTAWVNATALPVFSGRGEFCGSILLVRDASRQAHLEQEVETLNEIASTDSLTKVANRAELSAQMPRFMAEHLDSGQPGSLMICDIDYFKKINDTFGHQAGDEALVTFAGILSETARESDIVARYGGEEFVIVCPGCDNMSATSRAEEIRRAVQRTAVPALGGRTMTASFGVTEIQRGDTEELLIARADRALMEAKESGRNRVVQVGAGLRESEPKEPVTPEEKTEQHASWLSWFRKTEDKCLARREMLAAVPRDIAVSKLAGFIHDHDADVLETTESRVSIRVDMNKSSIERRTGERPAVLLMEIDIMSVDFRPAKASQYQSRTKLDVRIRAVRSRDRRGEVLRSQASQLLVSISSYLVTQDVTDELRLSIIEPR